MDAKSSANPTPAETTPGDAVNRRRQRRVSWLPLVGIQGTLLFLLLVVLVPVLITQAVVYRFRLQSRRAQELEANLELARSVSALFDAYVHDVLHQEQAVGLQLTQQASLTPEQMSEILVSNNREYASVRDLAWVSPAGQVVASSEPAATNLDVRDLDYFQALSGGQDWVVSDLFQSKVDRQPVFVIARSIRLTDRPLRGIVIAEVDPTRLDSVLTVVRGRQGSFSIVDRHGWAVYHYPEIGLSWAQRDWIDTMPLLQTALAGHEVADAYQSPIDGQTQIGGLAPITSIHWVAIADRPEAEVAMSDLRDFLGSFIVLLVVGLIAFLVALRTSRTLTHPIDHLRDHATAIGRGELSRRVKVTGPAELEELADAFNRMASEIREQEARREEYVHTISHDLRAPLAIIQGHAHILEGEIPRAQPESLAQHSVDAILKGTRRMNAMIQDLVDSARLEAGQLRMNPETVDLGAFVHDLRERLIGVDRGRRVRLNAPSDLPSVTVDPDRLERILMNLITNALKYADDETPVEVSLRRHDEEVILSVADHGPGISPEEISSLFQPYRRVSSTREHRESVGLGLYIARRLVEASHGRIWVESEPGRGSTFSLALPVAHATPMVHESKGGIYD